MTRQKQIFLETEGDAWFRRNHDFLNNRTASNDPLFPTIERVIGTYSKAEAAPVVLEVGCAAGKRLKAIDTHLGVKTKGIEPSAEAVTVARADGLDVVQGTADQLLFEDQSIDLLIFGFCLYLCDRDDLFTIAKEADRVLRNPGWVLIQDFYSPVPRQREYSHRSGILTHKMDFRQLFLWHPAYTCFSHEVRDHADGAFTAEREDWTAISLLRKD